MQLLKKHEKPIPPTKKLQSVCHRGKKVKGVILEEWALGFLSTCWKQFSFSNLKQFTVTFYYFSELPLQNYPNLVFFSNPCCILRYSIISVSDTPMRCAISGCIEMSTHTDKRAKISTTLAADDSEDDAHGAASVFEQAQKRLRVTTQETGDGQELSLKMPKPAGGDEEDELHALIWGGLQVNNSDDEDEGKKKKKSSTTSGCNRNRRAKSDVPARSEEQSSGACSSSGAADGNGSGPSDGLWAGLSLQPTSSKQMHHESKELDRIESVVLQSKQLSGLLCDSRTVMQVTVAKARGMLEKLEAKSTDEVTKMMLESIKKDGPNCRAANVMQSLKDANCLVDAIVEFVEALHDSEATCDTLRTRSIALKDLGIVLLRSLNLVMCRRSAELLLSQGDLEQVLKFLDPKFASEIPEGIASVLLNDETEEKRDALIMEFQSGCITHCINQILMRDFSASASVPGTSEECLVCIFRSQDSRFYPS